MATSNDKTLSLKPSFLCEPCQRLQENRQAEMYCKNCEEFQCSNCLENHKRFPMMSKHIMVPMDEVQSTERCSNLVGFDICEEHQSPIEIYCERHDEFCCIKCAFRKHRPCSEAKDVSEYIMKFEQSGEKTLYKKQLENCVKETDNIALISEERTEKVEKEILEMTNKLKDQILDMFEDQQSQILKELQAKSEENGERGGAMLEIREIRTEVKTWQATLVDLMAHGTDEQCFILSKKTMTKLSKHEHAIQQMKTESESKKKECVVNINKNITNLVQRKTKLFTLSFRDHDRAQEIQNSSEIEEQPSNLLNDKTVKTPSLSGYKDSKPQKVQLILLASLQLKKNRKKHEPYVKGVDFFPDGRIVSIDSWNKKCFVMDKTLKSLGKPFHFQDFPQGICAYSDERMAVSVENYVFLIQVDKCNKFQLLKNFSLSSKYDSITKFNCSMFIGTTMNEDHYPVYTFDMEGNEVNYSNIKFPKQVYKADGKSCTFISEQGIIVLTDKEESKVHMFNIHTGASKTLEEDDRILGPSQPCVGKDNTVFVCCQENDSIVRILPDGEILQVLPVQLEMPRAVSISKDGKKIIVSGTFPGKKKLQLYEIVPCQWSK